MTAVSASYGHDQYDRGEYAASQTAVISLPAVSASYGHDQYDRGEYAASKTAIICV